MRAPEIDRVRAAHDRMIGIDPNRDARVVTFVSRPQHARVDPLISRVTAQGPIAARQVTTRWIANQSRSVPATSAQRNQARSRRQGRSPPVGGSKPRAEP